MRSLWLIIISLVVALVAGAATFLTAKTGPVDISGRCPGCKVASCCLLLNARQIEEICSADCGFSEEGFELNRRLSEERFRLADLLETSSSSDQAIMAQVEVVITAHEALVDRVVDHVLRIRPYLTLDQQRKLMGMCVDSLNGRWCGQARNECQGADGPNCPGAGSQGCQEGGSGDSSRRGRGIGRTLAVVKRSDGTFASELDRLQAEVSAQRAKLVDLLSNERSTDDEMRQQIKAFAHAHNSMERSIASYVLKVRKTLTVEQQKSLVLMCTRGIRGME